MFILRKTAAQYFINFVSFACIGGMIVVSGCNTQIDSKSGQQSSDNESHPETQKEIKQLISKLASQKNRPHGGIPSIPLKGGKPFLTNNNGEITKVDLNYSPLTDTDLKKLCEASTIEYLSLVGTKITNEGLIHLKGLSNLTVLKLSGTAVTDEGLEHLQELKSLEYLGSTLTGITKEGKNKLKQALPNFEAP